MIGPLRPLAVYCILYRLRKRLLILSSNNGGKRLYIPAFRRERKREDKSKTRRERVKALTFLLQFLFALQFLSLLRTLTPSKS
ncbi:hypothetical protein RIF29_24276 [Crotalaria pallida]|uniref:Uncharacterized protein n=1 Tax=Crotalaria pallida TaxID=3830 RepID=A0AAN9EKA6_CROPI